MIKLKCNACDGIGENDLDIRFGNKCDNFCPFCFNRNFGRPFQKFDLQKVIDATLEQAPRECINIVGGEPLLPCMLDDLLTYLKAVRHTAKQICIITSLPQIPEAKRETFENILELTDDLIVSLQHYDSKWNNRLMRSSNKYDRIAALTELSKSKYSAKLSITLNISLAGINTEEKLGNALKFFDSLKIKYVRINELGNTPLHLSIKEVIPDYKFKSPYAHGCNIDISKFLIKKYNLKNIKTLKARTRCFWVEDSEKATLADLIKTKIKLRAKQRADKTGKVYKYTRHRPTVIYEDGMVDWAWMLYEKEE